MSKLTDLLAQMDEENGAPNPVNPPEAAPVLADSTEPETAGEPEPPTEDEIAAKAILASRESAKAAKAAAKEAQRANPPKRTRRTVADADAEIVLLKAQLAELDNGGCSDAEAEQRFTDMESDNAEMMGECRSLKKENDKLAKEVEDLTAIGEKLIDQNEKLKIQLDAASSTSGIVVANATRVEDLVQELSRRDFTVCLTYGPVTT